MEYIVYKRLDREGLVGKPQNKLTADGIQHKYMKYLKTKKCSLSAEIIILVLH